MVEYKLVRSDGGRLLSRHGTGKQTRRNWTPLPQEPRFCRLTCRLTEQREQEICVERIYLGKLFALKSGLMADLLTSRVRVPDDPDFRKNCLND